MQTPEYKKALIGKLEPGDLICVRGEQPLGKAIRFFTDSNINHVGIYTGQGILEAMIPKVETNSLDKYINDNGTELYCCKVKGIDSIEKNRILNYAILTTSGEQYDVLGIAGIAFRFTVQRYWWRLGKFIKFYGKNKVASPKSVWCSELVGRVYGAFNIKFTDEDTTWLTPDQIYNSNAVEKVLLGYSL